MIIKLPGDQIATRHLPMTTTGQFLMSFDKKLTMAGQLLVLPAPVPRSLDDPFDLTAAELTIHHAAHLVRIISVEDGG